MKITRTLIHRPDVNDYYLPAKKGEDFGPVALCDRFIQELLGNKPLKVKVTVSDKPFLGAQAVVISQRSAEGYVKKDWNWVNPEKKRTDDTFNFYDGTYAVLEKFEAYKTVATMPFILFVSGVVIEA